MNKTPTKAKSLEQSQTGSGTQQQKIFSSFIVYFLYFFFRHCLQVKFVLDSSSSSKVPRWTKGAWNQRMQILHDIQLIDISSPSRTTHFGAAQSPSSLSSSSLTASVWTFRSKSLMVRCFVFLFLEDVVFCVDAASPFLNLFVWFFVFLWWFKVDKDWYSAPQTSHLNIAGVFALSFCRRWNIPLCRSALVLDLKWYLNSNKKKKLI